MSTPSISRRQMMGGSLAAIGAGALQAQGVAPAIRRTAVKPVVVASANGVKACVRTAFERIVSGQPVVDSCVEGVTLVENDPTDHSVGYGGLPNERGIVQLDASVMDGPSGLSGAVACIEDIKNPSQVAWHVMKFTDHCLLVGEGAKEFAKAHGFRETELLTDKAREIWLNWKANLNANDDWFPKKDLPPAVKRWFKSTGTINCNGVAPNGDLGGVTTTSGLAFKIPGRVGDSPIIGAGLYVDNDHGAAGSTGRGEANIITCGSFSVVEGMRRGMHPKDACVYAAKNVMRMTKAKHLVRDDGKPNFNVKWYAVDKKGRHGGGAIQPGGTYALCDEDGPRLEPLASPQD